MPATIEHVVAVIDQWWGGRPMSGRLSHVFFVHFRPTSFVLECDGELLGFLIGFVSQTAPDEAYVHFVGVHPGYRQLGLGRRLYGRFCTVAGLHGCQRCAQPHRAREPAVDRVPQRPGLRVDPGDDDVGGVSDGRLRWFGEHRVRFVKRLGFAVPQLSPELGDAGPEPAAAVGW